MKAFFRDIFEFHHHFNQKLAGQLLDLEEKLPERTVSLFSHSLNAHQIWNARIIRKKTLGVHQLHTLEECKRIDRENYDETLKILDERELDETIVYTNSKGDKFSNSIREILFHIANHHSHHRGQIVSDIRLAGVAPIVTDYIFYKR
ncbi:DinB family protein [Sinomicrobium soli]|uniref:DinB family protein n=1 Tax=Sinomicrobium sp. N-1-3-6 TaxID=2219864 RepID=UPI000DCEFB4A|nr:DinB family protein [Sinomicrobium sp. N-1-3-6]RAV29320.1 damage-inducible protein DinB [Sinomicrobium sp. N-1-3-6]